MSGDQRRGDAHRLLLRALVARAGGSPGAIIPGASSEAWASATFHGARHAIALRLEGPDASTRASQLSTEMDAIEFQLPGHLVADITVVAREDDGAAVTLQIEALTVEDA